MFIGGSPGGTAGGLKTTTFALLFLAFHTMLRGGHDIECFRRKVDEKNFHVAFVTIMLALAICITGADGIDVYRTCRAYDHCIIICRKGELKRKDADTSNGKDYDWVTRRKRL